MLLVKATVHYHKKLKYELGELSELVNRVN